MADMQYIQIGLFKVTEWPPFGTELFNRLVISLFVSHLFVGIVTFHFDFEDMILVLLITQTCPCNILRYFTAEKMIIFR